MSKKEHDKLESEVSMVMVDGTTSFLVTDNSMDSFHDLMYNAIYSELIRLRQCQDKKERQKIRLFILESYKLVAQNYPTEGCREIFQDNMCCNNTDYPVQYSNN